MKQNGTQSGVGCIAFLGGLVIFGLVVWEITELGVDNPTALILTILFTAGPVIIVGLGFSALLGWLTRKDQKG